MSIARCLKPDVYSQMTKYLQPDLNSQRVHEAEEPGGLPAGDLEEDGDAQVHEGLHRRQHTCSYCTTAPHRSLSLVKKKAACFRADSDLAVYKTIYFRKGKICIFYIQKLYI
jgi:hypothetical protein